MRIPSRLLVKRKAKGIEISDLFRSLLLSWLWAVTIEYLLLPAQARSPEGLVSFQHISMSRILLLCSFLFSATVGLSRLFQTVTLQRWSIACAFTVLSIASLSAAFRWAYFAACILLLALITAYCLIGWNASQRPAEDNTASGPFCRWLTVSLCILFFLFVSCWTVCRIYAFSTPTYDFGIFSQMFYYMRTTGLPLTTLERDGLLSHFAVHMSPIYYLLLPIYCLLPTPATLQVLQAAVVTSAIVPLWLIGRKLGLRPYMRLLLCAAGLLYPALSGACGYDIHENCFLAPLLLWLLYGLMTMRIPLIILSAGLTLIVKEDAAVYVAVIGLYQLISALLGTCISKRKALLTGIMLLLCSIGWFFMATTILAHHGDGVMTYRYSNFMTDRTGSLLQVVTAVIKNPMKAVYECTDTEKLPFIAQTLLPLLGLPLLTRRYERMILLIPYVLVNLMTDYIYQYNILFQYTFGSGALLLYLAAANLADLNGSAKKYLVLTATVIVSAVCFFSFIFPTAIRYPVYCVQYRQHYDRIRQALSIIPEDASVAASTFYTTELSQRNILYDLDYCSKAHLLECEYVIISITGQKNFEQLTKYLEDMGYRPIGELPEVLIIYTAN